MVNTIKLLDYNLRNHRASSELDALIATHQADVLCLQECDTTKLPEFIGPLHLAHSTSTSRLGLALYYDSRQFRLLDAQNFALKKSLHDRILSPADERLLAAKLEVLSTNETIVAASFHAAPLSALNSLRRHQIRHSHELLRAFGELSPIVMAGDFNYPLFHGKLHRTVQGTGYDLTLSDERTYTRWFGGHFDFVTSLGMAIHEVITLPQGASDHRPILVTMSV